MKDTFGEEKVLKFGGRVASQSKQPGLNDPASFLSHRHACSTSTGPSAPQSRDARIHTGRSNPPCIPVVPAVQVKLFLFVAR